MNENRPVQSSDLLLMIRPASFRKNEQTAVNNGYQQDAAPNEDAALLALQEFDRLVEALQEVDIDVAVYDDDPDADTPDALFPNNWVSFHGDGRVGLHPMFAENRRRERREDLLHRLVSDHGREIDALVDFTEFESHNVFLEGTGSLVLDRLNSIAYASIGPRTDLRAAEQFAEIFELELEAFTAHQTTGDREAPIYHTNLMLAIGSQWAVVCDEIIADENERRSLLSRLEESGREVIRISAEQVNGFAGNVLEVRNRLGETFIAMSTAAYGSFTEEQRETLCSFARIVHAPIPTIERLGGGSVRCMLAEVFLPKAQH